MADDEKERDVLTCDPGTAETSTSDSDDENEPGLPRWRRRRRRQRRLRKLQASTPSPATEPSTTETSTPKSFDPSNSNPRSASLSPVKRVAAAVVGAVCTALRKAIMSQCCIKPADEASSNEPSPVHHKPTPEELLQKTPEKPCLRRRTPDAISPILKVRFTGVPEVSTDEIDSSSTCEGEPDEQRLPQWPPRSSSQETREMPQSRKEHHVVVHVHPPPPTLPVEIAGSSSED
ncbi:hypothetical protein HPB52_019661 [Rhipicephalus sanguineus]|uniref:Uncharacterized protein n=1 Tax=Rhipicephalus sanguineus TaxID=34632 RepID=A0A9D4PFE9_RHISA|nr:hypothetical protein HPB52_019661 [Rhipicephalus sanguineus]